MPTKTGSRKPVGELYTHKEIRSGNADFNPIQNSNAQTDQTDY